MFVLIDMEWYEYGDSGRWLTQMAARRMDTSWTSTEAFDCLVRPECTAAPDWGHMAYRGYEPEDFLAGKWEKECIEEFSRWLREDDIICCWHSDTRKFLRELYQKHLGQECRLHIKCVKYQINELARQKKISGRGSYALAEACGANVLYPEHCSANDVAMLIQLFKRLNVRQDSLYTPPPPPREPLTKRERNADIIERAEYNYLYIPRAKVFHSRSCKIMLNANTILGSVFYKTAANGRCPCKICRPSPELEKERAAAQANSTDEKEPAPAPKIVRAKLIDGTVKEISEAKLVGVCRYYKHPGKLTKQLLEKHDCLAKGCYHLEKIETSPYWAELEAQQQKKQEIKIQRQRKKEAEASSADAMQKLKEQLQSYIDDIGYSMYIVRVEEERSFYFRIFYVSDNRFADGNRFPLFLETARFFLPYHRFSLRHIRDVDGHFVTNDEYMCRRR